MTDLDRKSRFAIQGVIANSPGGRWRHQPGSRVLIDYADLPATGLLGFGSRAVRQKLLRLPEASWRSLRRRRALRPQFVRSYQDRQNRWRGPFGRAENYLSWWASRWVLRIAVSNVTRVFVRQKIKHRGDEVRAARAAKSYRYPCSRRWRSAVRQPDWCWGGLAIALIPADMTRSILR